ncbi:hypothetical protein [Actinoplanes sp. NPDC049316]|uniref:hypothetical protein n=1 Tax=Actinoplanes sp. NPDC049316 TaxID=3154727 RepID=UPI003414B7C2
MQSNGTKAREFETNFRARRPSPALSPPGSPGGAILNVISVLNWYAFAPAATVTPPC